MTETETLPLVTLFKALGDSSRLKILGLLAHAPQSVEAIAADYGKFVPVPRLKAGLARLFDRVAERQPGDVLLLRMGGVAQHLAIYAPTETQPDRIIEAMPTGPGKVRPGRATAVRIDSVWRWRTTHADS